MRSSLSPCQSYRTGTSTPPPAGAYRAEANAPEHFDAHGGVAFPQSHGLHGDTMSAQTESLADCYACERCHMYFNRAALDFSWRPIMRERCPNCMQPWTSIPAPPAVSAVTHHEQPQQ